MQLNWLFELIQLGAMKETPALDIVPSLDPSLYALIYFNVDVGAKNNIF